MTTTVGDSKIARAPVASPARAERWRQWIAVPVSGFLTALRAPLRGAGAAPVDDGGSRFVPVRSAPSSSPWASPPPSLAALHAYTRGGEWVPGERAPVLEFLGKSYGYLIAIPVHAVAYAVLWVVERPTRLLLASVIWLALDWTATS